MPNRILKESITTSENIDKLTAFQETVFYRLIVTCDDFGRADARPKLLASKLFPLKDIRPAQIEDALRGLTSAELVITYTVGGKPFLQMKTWDRHQQVRNKVSKYPSPEDADNCKQLIANDINCNQLQSNVPVIQSNPIQSESLSESESNARGGAMASSDAEAFNRFWSVYPKKVGKKDAWRAFLKAMNEKGGGQGSARPTADAMIEAVERQKRSEQWTKEGGRYIPNPATWLNQGRWEDELPAARGDGYQKHDQELSAEMADWIRRSYEQEDANER
ncbi:MAG: hypothetical protein IJK29_10940 [Bacteroidales bacterium]|nr:hypothetical protein [Bacteroidales bacterium]